MMDMLVIFLMAVTKSLTSSAREGGFVLVPVEGLRFHQGGEDMAEEGEAAHHIAYTVTKQIMDRKWDWVTKPQGPPHRTTSSLSALPPEASTAFMNSATSWGPSVQTHVPEGDRSRSNYGSGY